MKAQEMETMLDKLTTIIDNIKKEQHDILNNEEQLINYECIFKNIELTTEGQQEVLEGKNERERKIKLLQLLEKNQDYNQLKNTIKDIKYNIRISMINLDLWKNKLKIYEILSRFQ